MRFVVLAVASLLAAMSAASAQTAIGSVERVAGEARGVLAGTETPVTAGGPVFLNETITTGADGRVALTLEDGTTLTIGENAEVVVDAFVFQPAGESQLHAGVVGAFRYISGKLEGGGTRDASVTTPVATIGVRGTDFWGGPIDGRYGIVILEGTVSITTAAGSSVTLDQVGMGVDIDAGVAAAPIIWGEARRQRALASVSFP